MTKISQPTPDHAAQPCSTSSNSFVHSKRSSNSRNTSSSSPGTNHTTVASRPKPLAQSEPQIKLESSARDASVRTDDVDPTVGSFVGMSVLRHHLGKWTNVSTLAYEAKSSEPDIWDIFVLAARNVLPSQNSIRIGYHICLMRFDDVPRSKRLYSVETKQFGLNGVSVGTGNE